MKFEEDKIKTNYNTYRNYLETRCKNLANYLNKEMQKINNDSYAYHENSSCFGMSNYIMIDYNDYNNDIYESITIRISDHSPTGSGSLCDAYIYIQDKEWGIIRKEVFEVFEKFITLTTGQKYILKHVPDSNKKLDVKNILP